MNCKNFRIRQKIRNGKRNIYYYCVLLKKEVDSSCWHECDKKEYKQYTPLKKRSKRQNKLERERYSIIYHNLQKCAECGLKNGSFDERIGTISHIDKNEVFEGSYRETSIKNGMIVPLCTYCHKKFHNDNSFNLKYKKLFQKEFLKNSSSQEFLNLFKKNYL